MNHHTTPHKRHKARKFPIRIAVFFTVFLLLCTLALYRGLVSRQYTVTSHKLQNTEPVKIALITDLHNYIYSIDQQPLISKIADMQPDLICLAGDITDGIRPMQGTELLLEGILPIAPCLYVTGNHEYWDHYEPTFAMLEHYGIPILRNESIEMKIKGQSFILYGIDDPHYSRPWDFDKFLTNWMPPKDDSYTILLSHRPDPIEFFARYGFDLVLSGHTHGGQVRIPFFANGLFAPDQGWFPKYAGGLYTVENTTLIISRGLAHYPQLPRVFNPPEVVEVRLMQTP